MEGIYIIKSHDVKHKCLEEILNLPLSGYEVIITKKASKRSTQQNAYYWNVLQICEESGYTKEELNRKLKRSLGLYDVIQDGEDKYLELRSSADLNKDEFTNLLTAALSLASDMGYAVPLAADYGYSFN